MPQDDKLQSQALADALRKQPAFASQSSPNTALAKALSVFPDKEFYKDVGTRLSDALVGGLQDVFKTPARWNDPNWTLGGMEADAWKNNPVGEFNRVMNGPAGLAPMAITVYHGSPHQFSAFDSAHIGKGEGAQAYGHGLYFAENPQVARGYADELGNTVVRVEGKNVGSAMSGAPADAARIVAQSGGVDQALAEAQRLANAKNPIYPYTIQRYNEALKRQLESLRGKNVAMESTGKLYKVDLPDEMAAKMLDWDKPLSQQPESVRKVLEPLVKEALRKGGTPTQNLDYYVARQTGSDIHELLRANIGNKNLAETVRNLGIPGIRYLDQGSRTAGQGTYNYVVFPGEEKALKILERK